MGESIRIGAAGRHRREEDGQDDTGEMRVAVGAHKGRVVLNFGRAVAWMELDPIEARNIAVMLLEKASRADGKSTTITMGI